MWESDQTMCFRFASLRFLIQEKPILFPDITYSFYQVWANLYRIPYVCPKLDGKFRIVKEDYYKVNGGIIFPNPNAPTAIMRKWISSKTFCVITETIL